MSPVYKFKVRFFAVVTDMDPLRIYVYHPGTFLFLCSEPYTATDPAGSICNRAPRPRNLGARGDGRAL